jgi:hypothetical protein
VRRVSIRDSNSRARSICSSGAERSNSSGTKLKPFRVDTLISFGSAGDTRSRIFANNSFGKSFPLFKLRTKLQKKHIHAGGLKFCDFFCDLLRRADQLRAKPSIRYRIVFERNPLFELGPRQPLLIVGKSTGRLANVADSL